MTTVLNTARTDAYAPAPAAALRIALLGLGHVGSAFAELARQPRDSHHISIVSALVRDVARPRAVDTRGIPLTCDPLAGLAADPDVLVEVMGGLEPARTIVLAALAKGIPVVTANKSLLAAHGDELFGAAAATSTPLFYEASVLAGVPFLGTFRRRPMARDVSGITGIFHGTSNFILSRMAADRVPFRDALADAQRAGYAEPDPSKDVQGDDAVEKLCVLLRHFGGWSVTPDEIDKTGIDGLEPEDLDQAARFGGVIRPLVAAEWDSDAVRACVGPAFVDAANPFARVNGVQNAVALKTRWAGDLFFAGPGAGPTVTAATVIDDTIEAQAVARDAAIRATAAAAASDPPPAAWRRPALDRAGGGPATGWFVRIAADRLATEQDAPALLAGLGIRLRRTSSLAARDGGARQWLLTAPCARDHVMAALDVLAARSGAKAYCIRAVE